MGREATYGKVMFEKIPKGREGVIWKSGRSCWQRELQRPSPQGEMYEESVGCRWGAMTGEISNWKWNRLCRSCGDQLLLRRAGKTLEASQQRSAIVCLLSYTHASPWLLRGLACLCGQGDV